MSVVFGCADVWLSLKSIGVLVEDHTWVSYRVAPGIDPQATPKLTDVAAAGSHHPEFAENPERYAATSIGAIESTITL
jgi:hypothetical protein